MRVPEAVVPLLPRVETARALDVEVKALFRTVRLFDRDPARVTPFAVLRLEGRFVTREQRAERVEVTESASMDQPPAVPESFFDAPRYFRYFRSLSAEPHRCTTCFVVPGRQLCIACGGAGRVSPNDATQQEFPCLGCGGSAYIPCSVCEGSGRARWADAVFLTDTSDRLERVYSPRGVRGEVGALQSFVMSREPPDALRIPLDGRSTRGPYRDAAPDADAWGHPMGDAIVRARADVELRLRARPLLHEVRAWAWPALELAWPGWPRERVALLAHDASGAPHVFVAARR